MVSWVSVLNLIPFSLKKIAKSLEDVNRILIPKKLLEYAQLESEVVLSAYNNKVELWSKSNYENELSIEADDLSSLAQHFYTQQSKNSSKED